MGTKTNAAAAAESYVADSAHIWLHPQLVKYGILVEPALLEQLQAASTAWLGVLSAYEAANRDYEAAEREAATEIPAGDFSAVRERAKRSADAADLAAAIQPSLVPAAKALGAATLRYLGAAYQAVIEEMAQLTREAKGLSPQLNVYYGRMNLLTSGGDRNGKRQPAVDALNAEYGAVTSRSAAIERRRSDLTAQQRMIEAIAQPFAVPSSLETSAANRRVPEVLFGHGLDAAAAGFAQRFAVRHVDRVTQNRVTPFTKRRHQHALERSAGTPFTRPSRVVEAS